MNKILSTSLNRLTIAVETKNQAVSAQSDGRAMQPMRVAAGVALPCVVGVVTSPFFVSKLNDAIANTFGAAR